MCRTPWIIMWKTRMKFQSMDLKSIHFGTLMAVGLFGVSYGLTESEFEKVAALPALVGKQLPFVPDQSLSLVLGQTVR